MIVGEEREAPYSRMAIPYLLMGNIEEEGTHLRHDTNHYKGLNITHPCWTLDDARAIMALAKPGARVLQMGAGFIGCISMESLAARDVKLSVVEMGDRMVPRMMGEAAGGMIKAWCEANGVAVCTGAKVESLERDGKVLKVKLSTGEVLDADLVISATGVKPNIGFLQDSGVTCLVGVLTDQHLQTNLAGIYAAGDCAEDFDKVSGKTVAGAIQPNAAEQVELTDAPTGRHLSLRFSGDRSIGRNAVGWAKHVGVMRGLVEGQVALGEWKDKRRAAPTSLMEAYLACAQAQQRSHAAS